MLSHGCSISPGIDESCTAVKGELEECRVISKTCLNTWQYNDVQGAENALDFIYSNIQFCPSAHLPADYQTQLLLKYIQSKYMCILWSNVTLSQTVQNYFYHESFCL